MPKNFGPLSPKVGRLLHGGDYNPDQWLAYPEVLKEDLRLMKLAHCNAFSMGIFAWAAIEREEGVFDFGWLDKVIEDIHKNGGQVVLATPSGAKPAWMSQKYPEIRRVNKDGTRQPHAGRHNHCYSSPVYRQKTALMARKLAERYGKHPALVLWHINNEFNSGECHCDFCYGNFRAWLKDKYKTLDALNHAWWNHFWSHTFNDWSQIEPRDWENLGMELDWRRFTTHICVDYFKNEIAPLREITPDIPVTTNFMGAWFGGLDYWKLAEIEDIASWDSYPSWHKHDDAWEASVTAFSHDVMRSMKNGKPFMLMESTPEGTNWMDVGKAKRPGLHLASSLQAVAHGSDTMMYFQWRKGRGSFEQFHGAVVDHEGTEKTRVFKEVARTGDLAEKLKPVLGTGVDAEVAFVFDWETRWAVELARGPRNSDKNYEQDAREHYFEFWRRGIAVDAVSLKHDISKYKVLVAPYLYMLPQDFADKIKAFVKNGGILVTTYLAGTVDEDTLCHLGGRPGLLREVLGIWAEETDVLYDHEGRSIKAGTKNPLGLKGSYQTRHYADVLHLEGAKALATYTNGWYANSPALTVNTYGKGSAYYIASRNDQKFLGDFYEGLSKSAGLRRALKSKIPDGVEVCERSDEKNRFVFVINYHNSPKTLALGGLKGMDLASGKRTGPSLKLAPYGVAVIQSSGNK